MKAQEGQLWGWMRRHRGWSLLLLLLPLVGLFILLIMLLLGLGVGLWLANLVHFGPPPPMGQNCGSIQYVSAYPEHPVRADADLQKLSCFWQAYQSCRAATISQTYAGVDAGGTNTVTSEWRNHHCALYGQEDLFANTESRTMTFLCTQLSKVGDSLQVSACDGIAPFVLDPGHSFYEAYPCGVVDAPLIIGIPQPEAGFLAAYQHCLADSMGYQMVSDGVQVVRYFYIDAHCGIAYLRGSYLATCASLESRADGFHFLQCGMDGDLFIPSSPP